MEEPFHLLPQILRQTGYQESVCEQVVLATWNRVVGEVVSANATPSRLYGKRLIVLTSDSTWKTQLEGMSREIIFAINRLLGVKIVTFIEYRVDPYQVKALRKRSPEITFRHLNEITQELEPIVQSIFDPELRRASLRAASKCIERTERG